MNVLDLIFPKKCLGCGAAGKYLCQTCLQNVPPGGWANKEVFSCYKYEGVIKKAIIALKYKFATDLVDELANCVLSVLVSSNLVSNDYCLAPIPLHWYRQNFRGFNQSTEVGKTISAKMGWQFAPDLLIRQKPTAPQVQLKGPARRSNLRGAFFLNPSCQVTKRLINQSSYIIFDDVMTTGSTLHEAIKTLGEKGFKRVWGLTIAR